MIKLLIHVEKGCLSDIPPSGGTSRNEGIHRILNKTLKKSRIGIQFAIALLGMFFIYGMKNKYQQRKTKEHTSYPSYRITFHFCKTSEDNNELFGILDQSDLSEMDGIENSDSDIRQEYSVSSMVAKVNNYLNDDHSSDSSSDAASPKCKTPSVKATDLNCSGPPDLLRSFVHISSCLANLKHFGQTLCLHKVP